MPWNPEHYSVKTKEVMKILEDNKITNVGKNTPYGDFRDEIVGAEEDWWERHKRYIEHRKKFPYYPDKNKSQK